MSNKKNIFKLVLYGSVIYTSMMGSPGATIFLDILDEVQELIGCVHNHEFLENQNYNVRLF